MKDKTSKVQRTKDNLTHKIKQQQSHLRQIEYSKSEVEVGGDGVALFNQNHNMENLPTEKGQIWLSTKEAADIWNITTRAMNKLIAAHRESLASGIYGGGSQGKKTYITKEALFSLRNIVNVKSKKDLGVLSGKKQIADKVMITERPDYVEAISKLAGIVESLTKEVNALKSSKQSLELGLELLPAPKSTPPDISLRAALNKFVRDTAQRTNRFYNVVFNELYSQFYYTFGINLVSRARKNSMSVIEYAEKYNHIQDLYDLARKIYKIK